MLFLSTLLLLSAAAATSPPQVLIKTSYSNGKFEAHPHSGVELVSGGFFMVGDSMTTGDGDTFRQQFAVKTASDGTEDWQVALGDVGYNYGKFGVELSDKTLLVFGSSSISDGSGSYSELRSIHRLDPEDGAVISHTVLPSKFGSGNDGFMGADLMTSGETSGDGYFISLWLTQLFSTIAADSDGLSVWATGYVGGEGQPEDEEAMFLIGGGSAFAMQLQFPSVSSKDRSEDAKVGAGRRAVRRHLILSMGGPCLITALRTTNTPPPPHTHTTFCVTRTPLAALALLAALAPLAAQPRCFGRTSSPRTTMDSTTPPVLGERRANLPNVVVHDNGGRATKLEA